MTDAAVVTRTTQDRALDATLELVARWGVNKTTLGDVAREAGMSRATLYRAFPGGKDELFGLLTHRETAHLVAEVAAEIDEAPDLATALTSALHGAAVRIRGHEALRFVLQHEPELAIPILGFDDFDRLLRVVRGSAAPHLVRFLPPEQAEWAAEWLVRIFVSTLVNPTPVFDLTDRVVCEGHVRRYILPAFTGSTTPSTSHPSGVAARDLRLVSH